MGQVFSSCFRPEAKKKKTMPAFKLTAPSLRPPTGPSGEPKREERIVTQYSVVGGISRVAKEIPVLSIMSPDQPEKAPVAVVPTEVAVIPTEVEVAVAKEAVAEVPAVVAEEFQQPETIEPALMDREPVVDHPETVVPADHQETVVVVDGASEEPEPACLCEATAQVPADQESAVPTDELEAPCRADWTIQADLTEALLGAPKVRFQEQQTKDALEVAHIPAAPLAWPPPPTKASTMAQHAETASKLVELWTDVAERRVNNGIVVCHMVDYFETIVQTQ